MKCGLVKAKITLARILGALLKLLHSQKFQERNFFSPEKPTVMLVDKIENSLSFSTYIMLDDADLCFKGTGLA